MNGKKTVEAIVLGSALVVSMGSLMSPVQAATGNACSLGVAAASVPGATAGSFVKNSFVPKCSSNVNVTFNDDGTNFAVHAGSKKGSFMYGGSTDGGKVDQCSTTTLADPSSPAGTAPTSATNGCS